MRPHFAALLALALVALPTAAAASDEIFPSDPRVIEANALLSDDAGWPRAIELYEQVLADDPEHLESRRWLARVHAWRKEYDASFAHYEVLRARPDAPPDLPAEYAEVLSWAGRYAEAEAAFQEILARDPNDLRAVRGLARVYKWSGRMRLAEETYARALALGEDEAVRSEIAELRAERDAGTEGSTRFFSDSDDVTVLRMGARAFLDLDIVTRLILESAWIRVDSDHGDPDLPEQDDALDALVTLERHFAHGLRVGVGAGYRHWMRASPQPLVRGDAELTLSDRTAVGVELRYEDFLRLSNSVQALQDDIDAATTRAWAWHAFDAAWSSYGWFEGTHLSDSNHRLALGGTTTWTPWSERDLRVQLDANYLRYGDDDPLYYAPEIDVTAQLAVLGSVPLYRGLRLATRVSAGLGYAKEAGASGFGSTYSVEGGPTWNGESWWASLRASRSQSQRSSVYTAHGVSLSFGRSF